MTAPARSRLQTALLSAVALIPWLLASFIFYWLDSSGTWTTETPHRGKLSVVILGTGMIMSFLIYTLLVKRDVK